MELGDDLLNGIRKAAEHCGLPQRTIAHFVETRAVPFKRVGRRVFFRKSELDAFFRAGEA